MPDAKISALPAITTLTPATDVLPVVDVSGATKKISVNQILGSSGTGSFASLTATTGTITTLTSTTGTITSLSASSGSLPASIRAAASDYAAVNFDGATSGTRISAPCQSIGVDDFTIWVRFRVPSSATASSISIIGTSTISTSTNAANALSLDIFSNGTLSLRRWGAVTFTDYRYAQISGFRTSYSGQIVDIVITRSGSTLKIYINGTDTAYSSATGGTVPSWGDTIASDYVYIGGTNASTGLYVGRLYRAVVFNRALSASDVSELITIGVNPADQWGTQTEVIGFNPAVLNGGFETNSLNASGTWFASAGGTSTATIDTSGSFSKSGANAGKLALDASSTYAGFNANNSTSIIQVNKRFRISFWARKGVGSNACGVQFGTGGSTGQYGNTQLVLTTTYANFVSEFISATDGTFAIGSLSGSAASSEIYIDDIELTRIGAILDLDFTVGAGYQAYDRTTNAQHGTLYNAVEFTMPKRTAVLYATTSTNGNQQMLGTISIPTNAVIEDIIVNSTGTSTVSIGNASAGTQIVNAASVVSGRQKLTLATPFSTTGNLWVNSNSTATLQFTILYTMAS